MKTTVDVQTPEDALRRLARTRANRRLTVRVMKLVPREKPERPSAKSRRVRKNKWVRA